METPDCNTVSRLRLALIPGLGPITHRNLVARFGSPAEVLAADREELAEFAGPTVARALARGAEPSQVERSLLWAQAPGHRLVFIDDPTYSPLLRHIPDPPAVIYAIGRVELLQSPTLAIVGSRNATPQGARDANALATALSDAGLCIASGLAAGIDACAHRGGLRGRSGSIAVMGTGADTFYPRRNRDLASRLAQEGCLITEFPLGTPPASGNFPRRNRLISGLALGVLVVEAGEQSGSLGTAHLAANQGREVFALPGSIHSPLSKGCHKLIREGAKLVECADHVLEELGLPHTGMPAVGSRDTHEPVLDAMGFDPLSADEIARRTGMAVEAIAARLAWLEIDGHVEAVDGGRFQRAARTA